jgi:hypothetical protein
LGYGLRGLRVVISEHAGLSRYGDDSEGRDACERERDGKR